MVKGYATPARRGVGGVCQRLRSENVQKVGPLSRWIILFGIFGHKLRSIFWTASKPPSGRPLLPALAATQPDRCGADFKSARLSPGSRSESEWWRVFFWLTLFLFVSFVLNELRSPSRKPIYTHPLLILHTADHPGPRQVWFYMKPLPPLCISAALLPAPACQLPTLINWIHGGKRSPNTAGYEVSRCLLPTIWNDNLSHGGKEKKIWLSRRQRCSVSTWARREHLFFSYSL